MEKDKMNNNHAIENGYKVKRIWASEIRGGDVLSLS